MPESPSFPMEASQSQSGGQLAANPSEDDTVVDRLSALPDDVLVRILIGLDDAAAASRTSVLSTRWRRLWLLLPELRFPLCSEPRAVATALAAHEAMLSSLNVGTLDADAESVAAWLPTVAHRLTGHLIFTNQLSPGRDAATNDDSEERGCLELPCLASATSVTLDLGRDSSLGLAVTPAGVFARLTDVSLTSVVFCGECALGDAVSSTRCPCLQKLTVRNAYGLYSLQIRSDSLREMMLGNVRGLERLAVASRALEYLTVSRCFISDQARPVLEYLSVLDCFISHWAQPVADISAPELKVLRWGDRFDPTSVHFGTMHLQTLSPVILVVYGTPDMVLNPDQDCLGLVRCFKTIQHLNLTLAYLPNIDGREFLMEDMTVLPDITTLLVRVIADQHAFGASLFHVLRLCSGIKKLILELAPPKVQAACLPSCICNEKHNWKTEELLLDHLQEVEVTGLRGSQHEVTLLKQLFSWATVLKKITTTFDHQVTESMAMELCQMFRSLSRPETCLKFNIELGGNVSSTKDDGDNIRPLNY